MSTGRRTGIGKAVKVGQCLLTSKQGKWPTAIDMRQIEHSCDACSDAASESFFGAVLPKSRNFLWVETLRRDQQILMNSMTDLK